jgi:putative glutamine amidotransferase
VEEAGGLAVALPVPYRVREGLQREAAARAEAAAAEVLAVVDGVLLSGGPDLDPETFGEAPAPGLGRVDWPRDIFELALARGALAAGTPLLGVCRGAQVLAVAAGGTIHQDLAGRNPGCLKHRQDAPRAAATHFVDVEPGTLLERLLGVDHVKVNSFHHQAVARVPEGFRVSAVAPDGVVEGLEPGRAASGELFCLGVQWHPECMWRTEPLFLRLFEGLVGAARTYREARASGGPRRREGGR